jgi:hypothetical protein
MRLMNEFTKPIKERKNHALQGFILLVEEKLHEDLMLLFTNAKYGSLEVPFFPAASGRVIHHPSTR